MLLSINAGLAKEIEPLRLRRREGLGVRFNTPADVLDKRLDGKIQAG